MVKCYLRKWVESPKFFDEFSDPKLWENRFQMLEKMCYKYKVAEIERYFKQVVKEHHKTCKTCYGTIPFDFLP